MVKAVSIEEALSGLAVRDGRTAETSAAEAETAFATPVPRGCWHPFQAPDGVTVLTATPLPTDHSATDPRTKR